MVESIGQFGPGYKPPRVPLLDKARKETTSGASANKGHLDDLELDDI